MTKTRVDFYLSEQTDPTMVLRTACRIIEKAYLNKHTIYIHCQDNTQLQTLDKLLWTFHDTSFIPHVHVSQSKTIPAPVILSEESAPQHLKNHDILINLTESLAENINNYNRVIEVVSAENSAREKARDRYRHYREQNLTLNSHQVS